jgi:hypothetical protein
MSELIELEKEIENLEDLLKNSIGNLAIIEGLIQKNAALKQNQNEPNYDSSNLNSERINIEKIETNKNYIDEFSSKIEESFLNLEKLALRLKDKEEYLQSEEELIKSINILNSNNNAKLEKINEAICESSKYLCKLERIAESIETNRQMLMFQLNKRRIDDSMNIDNNY